MTQTARVALVGDRSDGVRSHVRIPMLFDRLAERDGLELDAYWIPTDAVGDVTGFDAVWLVPGSPYRSEAGAVDTVRAARENGIPFLGTCAGFQHALLEFARNVCGLGGIGHGENAPESAERLIVPLACSLVGHESAVHVTPGTLAARILGADRSVERYHCSYGLDARHRDTLAANGLVFSGFDGEGDARIAELSEPPFFLATLFQPELAGDGTRPHPLVHAFASAAVEHVNRSVHSGR
ncbi:hypothetical protein DL991_02915 [Amycolatopsis sp. WAC 01375]|uniref:CTP synthase C-terminal region-related (seleno)protein n=1 Tax=Amycolatopsis sp. WAC 01375 TaxID=2203194 RepID=UPI000F7701E0|nr:hypothetical protein [Amycolatopsis sp. WAC 01375]RSM83389.1 hypothetical protein DL991_02915 [Amycolatopsis sp. WAC 01375]